MGKSKPKSGVRYTPEFRRQMVELVRAGRKASELEREFGVTSWSIGRWVAQANRDAGRGDGGLTTAERQELARLRRENRQLSSSGKSSQMYGLPPAMQDLFRRNCHKHVSRKCIRPIGGSVSLLALMGSRT